MSLQSKVLKELKAKPGVFVFKTIQCNERGIPDIIVCCKGKAIYIEIKEGKDCLSEIQKAQIERIKDAGGQAWVVYNIMEFRMYWMAMEANND